jgi:hypothetical protein
MIGGLAPKLTCLATAAAAAAAAAVVVVIVVYLRHKKVQILNVL